MATRLQTPPIVEVVCGFIFSPMAGMDPLTVGKYWAVHKEKAKDLPFPTKQLLPPVTEHGGLVLGDGIGPLRCWLVSEAEDYLVQIQPDRFYFNWRKRGEAYPHFSSREGQIGVLDRGLSEFEEFSNFCRTALGHAPDVTRLELTKIDVIEQGVHFQDLADLGQLLPLVAEARKIARTPEPLLELKIAESRDDHDIRFQLTTAAPANDLRAAVQMETRAVTAVQDGAFREGFATMNRIVNEVFFGVIAATELHRFGGTKS